MRMRFGIAACLIALLMQGTVVSSAAGNGGDADLLRDRIGIRTNFSRNDLVIFGHADSKVEGVVIVLHGAYHREAQIFEKTQQAGIWINGDSRFYRNVPEIYHIYASHPLEGLVPPGLRVARQLTPRTVLYDNHGTRWDSGVLQSLAESGRVHTDLQSLQLDDSGLFRLEVALPPWLSPSTYSLDIFYFGEGKLIEHEYRRFAVHRSGFGARLYGFAHEYPFGHGVLAVIFAIGMGYLVNTLARLIGAYLRR